MVVFLLMQASCSFCEYRANLTDIFFLVVITAEDTKPFEIVLSALSRCSFLSAFLALFVPYFGSGLVGVFFSVVSAFIVGLFMLRSSNSPIIFHGFHCWLHFEYCLFLFPCKPISSLSSQFNPNNGCVALFSVISIAIFHCSSRF